MDPITGFIAAAGLITSVVGGMNATAAAKQQAGIQKNIAGLEMQQDQVRRQAMELSSHRQSMEVLRNAQRARSLGLQNATSQGAQQGSGLQGGYGQISGQTNVNQLGISQNLSLGENMFDLNNQISKQKMAYADAGSSLATAQGISSLGKSITGVAGMAGNLAKGINFGSSGSGGDPTAGANESYTSGFF